MRAVTVADVVVASRCTTGSATSGTTTRRPRGVLTIHTRLSEHDRYPRFFGAGTGGDAGELIGIVTRRDMHDGIVAIGDEFDDETDRHVATVLAESVPEVVRATALAAHEEDDR